MTHFRRSFTAPGAPPGSFVTSEHAVSPRITHMAFDAEELREGKHEDLTDLPGLQDLEDPAQVDWIDVRGLGDGSIVRELGRQLGLHQLAVSDAMNVGQRPKVDEYEGMLFVVLHMVNLDPGQALRWEQVSIFLGNNFVLSLQETHEDCLEPLRMRIRAGRKQIRTGGASYLACMVVDAIVDGYFPVLEQYGDRLEEFENSVFAQRGGDVLDKLYLTKRDLASFRRAAWPLREALAELLRDDGTHLDELSRLHLRDTLDHTMQVVEVNESYRELAASLVDVHLSLVGQRTNEVMRVLTVVSAIFIPLTFLAGIYGMNFDTSQPWNLPELGWSYGYLVFWGLCLLLGGCLLLLFRRLGWLR